MRLFSALGNFQDSLFESFRCEVKLFEVYTVDYRELS